MDGSDERNVTMSKRLLRVPVYTHDSIRLQGVSDDDKDKMIDEWTDRLATKMAEMTSDVSLVNDFGIEIERRERRGGHYKLTIEMLNDEGYVVKIFESITEAAQYFGVNAETVSRLLDGKRKSPLIPGYTLRRRETDKQRKAREKAVAKATKKRNKTISKKNKLKNKRNYGKE